MFALRPAIVKLVGWAVLAMWLVIAASASQGLAQPSAVRFIDALGDVPLAPNLILVPNSAVSFDVPGGRIVQVRAQGRTNRAAVRRYYRSVLPNLGWRKMNVGAKAVRAQAKRLEFRREGEKLVLDIATRNKGVTVLFRLAPGR